MPLFRERRRGEWAEIPSSKLLLELEPEGFGEALRPLPPKGLTVEVIRALLPRNATLAPMSVTVAVGQQKERTAVQPASPEPVFNERFEFVVADEDLDTLNLALLDANGQPVGMYQVRVNDLKDGVRQEIVPKLFAKGEQGQWIVPEMPHRVVLALTARGFGQGPESAGRAQAGSPQAAAASAAATPAASAAAAAPTTPPAPALPEQAAEAVPEKRLSVRLLGATGIAAPDSEPYVVVRVGSATSQSKPSRAGVEPVWEERFKFAVEDVQEQTVEVAVIDQVAGATRMPKSQSGPANLSHIPTQN